MSERNETVTSVLVVHQLAQGLEGITGSVVGSGIDLETETLRYVIFKAILVPFIMWHLSLVLLLTLISRTPLSEVLRASV